jgi:hypothetical protein
MTVETAGTVAERIWLGLDPDVVVRAELRLDAVLPELARIVADGRDPMLRAQAAVARAHLDGVLMLLREGRR